MVAVMKFTLTATPMISMSNGEKYRKTMIINAKKDDKGKRGYMKEDANEAVTTH